MNTHPNFRADTHIAIIGGGIAGSTAAIHFSELGYRVTLIEQGAELVSGPPICHLHAGGNLYREISTEHCLTLLKQSIDSVRLFPHTINHRPTVIAIPQSDGGEPMAIVPRLKQIQACYSELVAQNPDNKVLGEPERYFKLYDQSSLEALLSSTQPESPSTLDEWLIPFAQHSDLSQLKYPVIAVEEHGWSLFRLAATAQLTLEQFPKTEIRCGYKVVDACQTESGWQLTLEGENDKSTSLRADYLINACGFETGRIDDALSLPRERLVEFKAAYVTHWSDSTHHWPEVIFHGPRNTDKGMAQLTPYGDGIFQLHGMTPNITLFSDGLVKSSQNSAQPELPKAHVAKIRQGWPQEELETRTQAAIAHLSQFIPRYGSAEPAGKPLFGAQQVPGDDISLRAADVSFEGSGYARIEIVKGSSTLQAAQKIAEHWFGLMPSNAIETQHPITMGWSASEIETKAIELTQKRGYPAALARISGRV
ncbi:FAD-dependent oxidoreductase [Vibrio sp. SM6]|uniref:FAD-dependent oxidoreductase n=1 Tax=Vibrio agarilyticus TaxID=2726741 RepID=A0A7X8YH54_9VIBR|nr:FAD-dependent oxidoreductase [Vibrio agarilyticus]NLS13389.1 FAD-dependent oxidoreductase [Vibrio agarilyticus]